jgi:histidinol phosphatase-like PHP family hydrolase
MPAAPLDLLVLADPHYVGHACHHCGLPERRTALAPVLVRKALARLQHEGIRPDAIVLLGDAVDNGDAAGADRDLRALAGELLRTGLPVLAVPGNHDNDAGAMAAAFGCPAGFRRIGDCVFLVFHDARVEGETFARPGDQLDLPRRAAAAHPGATLVALQHHVLHPAIHENYPYMLANADRVLDGYRDAGVRLSLSGHFHAGQPATERDGTLYVTAPALAESPFRFLHVRLAAGAATVRECALRLDVPGLADVHCHTEFAYCGTTVNAADAIALSRALGVGTVCLVEHAFQLYFEREEAWSFRWQREPGRVAAAWAAPSRGRMEAYRRFASGLRGDGVRLGIEVELLADGGLLLAPADAAGWDLLVGAIHEIPEFQRGVTTQAEAEALFLRDVGRLLAHPIQVLAHPFRFFARKGLEKPAHLYPVLAERLAAAGVAAEINYHTNAPEPAFVRACLDRGVRLAFGSDAHDLVEVGEFAPHLALLRQAGVARPSLYAPGR